MNIKNTILFVLLLGCIAGCSNQVGLSGKVVYSDDKSPVPAGTVYFETSTFVARGNIRPDGTFVVGSVGDKDGLPPGTYRVSVRDAEQPVGRDAEGNAVYQLLFNPDSVSNLTIDITSTTKNFEIEVDRNVPTRKKN